MLVTPVAVMVPEPEAAMLAPVPTVIAAPVLVPVVIALNAGLPPPGQVWELGGPPEPPDTRHLFAVASSSASCARGTVKLQSNSVSAALRITKSLPTQPASSTIVERLPPPPVPGPPPPPVSPPWPRASDAINTQPRTIAQRRIARSSPLPAPPERRAQSPSPRPRFRASHHRGCSGPCGRSRAGSCPARS